MSRLCLIYIINMFWCKWVWYVLFLAIELTSAEYSCYLNGKNISCTSITEKKLQENIVVTLSDKNNNDIEEIVIEDSWISSIEENTFANFNNLQRLHLKNTQTRYIEEAAFANLLNLKTLYLTDNYLEAINSNAFAVNNSLHTLDISHNLLRDLNNFDASIFPSLAIMNISHNRMEYLPDSIMTKLEEVNTFYLIVDNNPWNCSYSSWIPHLTDTLIDAFCTNHTYDSSEAEWKMEALESLAAKNNSTYPTDCFIKCSLIHCLWWIIGGVWVGIILGNVCKLKRLLFTEPRRYEDKNTQCDKADLLVKT